MGAQPNADDFEYHHVGTKVDNVARMVRYGWTHLRAEIDKCLTLCVPYHMLLDPSRKGR